MDDNTQQYRKQTIMLLQEKEVKHIKVETLWCPSLVSINHFTFISYSRILWFVPLPCLDSSALIQNMYKEPKPIIHTSYRAKKRQHISNWMHAISILLLFAVLSRLGERHFVFLVLVLVVVIWLVASTTIWWNIMQATFVPRKQYDSKCDSKTLARQPKHGAYTTMFVLSSSLNNTYSMYGCMLYILSSNTSHYIPLWSCKNYSENLNHISDEMRNVCITYIEEQWLCFIRLIITR